MSKVTRATWAKFEFLQIKDGVLYLLPTANKKHHTARVVLPASLVEPALKRVHDGLEGGHMDRFKTLKKMQARFWRPELPGTVHDYCSKCLTCGQCKSPPRKSKAPLQPIASGYPFQRVHIDIIGPLPRSKRGNKYILTAQCSFTKWAEAYPLPNQRATTCTKALVNNWILRYGAPDSIHSDQGRNFESNVFSEVCQMQHIKKTRTTAYHPAGNGQVENFNRSVKSLLKPRIEDDPETWDQHLGPCMMAFRSSIHTSTQYTPYSLLFGREMRVPLDVMMGETPTTSQSSNYGEHDTNLKSTLTNAYQAVRTHLSAAQRRQKEYFDKGVTQTKYEPGDQVFLFNPQLKVGEASKFHRNWKGPYVVLEQPTDDRRHIQDN
ncbi:hypothetical protein QZH41_000260 [Actinostola sp. cb2023]|nr:hypothetical protein QZH41_000260 [Actinostola sp. cb2023]